MDKDVLRKIPLFTQLNDTDLEELCELLQEKTYAQHQPIFWIGERGDNMFIVEEGQVRMSYPDEKGQDITLAVVGPGEFFGELSLLDGGTRTATARAHTDATLLTLDRYVFYLFLQQHPKEALPLIATLASRLREAMSKLRGITNLNKQVEERLTPFQKLVDKATGVISSVRFLICTIVFIICWLAGHTYLAWRHHPEKLSFTDDPPTFFWLGLMVTLTAFLFTILILNSQRRQAERDRIRADIEYQVNLQAHMEVMSLHQKMDKVLATLAKNDQQPAEPQHREMH